VLQQLKHNEARIVKLAMDVMVKILSLGKVGIVNCVVWFCDNPSLHYCICYFLLKLKKSIT